MNKTKIEWCHRTWNPVIGCSKVSEGCENCYAATMAKRLEAMGKPEYAGITLDIGFGMNEWSELVSCVESRLTEPLRLRKPSRIFVCSMSDLFHEKVPLEFIADIFNIMAYCPRHTFLSLTKRPACMLRILDDMMSGEHSLGNADWPLPNVWLGVTAENQHRADERIPILLQTPAALRFVSCEPMLEPIFLPPFTGGQKGGSEIAWVICGGETGPHARPFSLDWARSLRDQCAAAGIPFFMKQGGDFLFRRGATFEDLPADLQIRQHPKV